VWVKTRGTNQRGELVLDYSRWLMVPKKNPGTMTGAADRPELPEAVAAKDLVVPSCLDLSKWEAWPAGGRALWEDYEIGEHLDHGDGMTMEEAEHAIATRLYQNTAKVHFDGHYIKDTRYGRRIIYGGHVISTTRALSFNGFENALAILAFNAGAHANPSFAGDTIYASSEILDRAEIPGRKDVGALRVRLVGIKNHDPRKEPLPLKVERDGREAYHPNVVLDLDHWLLLPRKR
jgi:2-methylfumaryl-CoA hydratase